MAVLGLQAYAVGMHTTEQVRARQDVQSQLQSSEGAVIPFCLVSDKSLHGDYRQLGLCNVNLQVALWTLFMLQQLA